MKSNTKMAMIKIDYDRTLILPLKAGMQLMELISDAELMKGYEGSSNGCRFEEYDETISFRVTTEKKIKELKMQYQVLDPEKNKEGE